MTEEPPPVPHKATLQRSVSLFQAFLVEQTDPDRFYTALAADSVGQLSKYGPLQDQLVLDVGGGPGYFAAAFDEAGARYVRLEPDAGDMASGAGDKDAAIGALRASGMELPIRTGSVDVCYSSNVLEHVPDPPRMLDEMVRVTRPGGLIYASFTPWLSPWGGHETAPWHYLGGHYAARRYERRNGKPPKNKYRHSLHPYSVGSALAWARKARGATLIEAFPRYHPWWAQWILKVPAAREVLSWNLAMVLRKH
ncbi:class I SAM-dependent methyltransferase [Actinoplanes sp. LDG1-06]|uniref:Class I SAM-dependent methyltransferase n=1 Tax=Paractinoplanes ovalisporus TaxID=2810368 RepID=A0ABS2A655_9ACTN|nr:class I SAM-dependent methyltransferase [Actinoplanes ovalisporus]MBM2614764.1 class I SAM-dependent methyltransferase [Actinoplanes ovalisporus]